MKKLSLALLVLLVPAVCCSAERKNLINNEKQQNNANVIFALNAGMGWDFQPTPYKSNKSNGYKKNELNEDKKEGPKFKLFAWLKKNRNAGAPSYKAPSYKALDRSSI